MFQLHVKRSAILACVGLGIAIAATVVMPKVYEGMCELSLNVGPSGRNVQPDVMEMVTNTETGGMAAQIGVLRSQGVFYRALTSDTLPSVRGQSLAKKYNLDITQAMKDLYPQVQVTGSQGSPVVKITTKAPNPQLAADLANALPEAFDDQRKETNDAGSATALEILQGRLTGASKQLDDKQNEIQAYKEQHKVVDIASDAMQTVNYSAQLEVQANAAQAELRANGSEINRIKAEMKKLDPTIIPSRSMVKSPEFKELESKLVSLQSLRVTELQRFTPESTKIREIDESIARTQAEINKIQQRYIQENYSETPNPQMQGLESQLMAANIAKYTIQSRLSSMQGVRAEKTKAILEMPKREKDFANLSRDLSMLEQMVRSYTAQLVQLKGERDRSFVASKQTFYASVNNIPTSPDIAKLAIVGIIGGAIVGVLLSFLNEAVRLPVRSSGQLTELTGLPVAATMPMLPGHKGRKLITKLKDKSFKPLESFRFMAFSLINPAEPGPKMVMFTGIGGGVGCSSAAAQFAIATAKSGVKTLLVDCDVRRPTLTKALDAQNKSGLSDMLNRSMLPSESDLTLDTEHKNLSFVPAGSERIDDLTEFSTSLIAGTLQNFRDKADVIVIDAPPCDVVSDTSRLVPYMDQVCVVVSAKSTSYKAVPVAYEILKRCGAKSIQLVLTHASPQDEPFARSSRYMINQG